MQVRIHGYLPLFRQSSWSRQTPQNPPWHAIVVFTSIAVIALFAVLINISRMRHTEYIELFLLMFKK